MTFLEYAFYNWSLVIHHENNKGTNILFLLKTSSQDSKGNIVFTSWRDGAPGPTSPFLHDIISEIFRIIKCLITVSKMSHKNGELPI